MAARRCGTTRSFDLVSVFARDRSRANLQKSNNELIESDRDWTQNRFRDARKSVNAMPPGINYPRARARAHRCCSIHARGVPYTDVLSRVLICINSFLCKRRDSTLNVGYHGKPPRGLHRGLNELLYARDACEHMRAQAATSTST